MATRGRESNRLYVDTCFDPDLATNHEEPAAADPLAVLQAVVSATGAEMSATETMRREEAALASPWRLQAEGAVVMQAREPAGALDRERSRDSRSPSL